MTKILIYQDYVYNNGSLFKALTDQFGVNNVGFIDADGLKRGDLTPATKALVMPGGASRYVSAKLNGTGNATIRDYVSAGGLYIGICAGAYYGAKNIVWKQDASDKIVVDNELAFYPGAAIGPVLQFDAAEIVPMSIDDKTVNVLYWNGPVFVENDTAETIARYTSLPGQPPAIVAGKFSKGRYLLVSPHLEFDSAQLEMLRFDVADNRHAEIAAMKTTAGLGRDTFHALMDRFLA